MDKRVINSKVDIQFHSVYSQFLGSSKARQGVLV